MDSVKVKQMIETLHNAGWENQPVGYFKSGSQIKQITDFEVFVRQRDLDDF